MQMGIRENHHLSIPLWEMKLTLFYLNPIIYDTYVIYDNSQLNLRYFIYNCH